MIIITCSVSVLFHCGVKPPCTVVRASKRAFIYYCASLHECPQSVNSGCWRTTTNKLSIKHIPDTFDEQSGECVGEETVIPVVIRGRLAQPSLHVARHCPAEI